MDVGPFSKSNWWNWDGGSPAQALYANPLPVKNRGVSGRLTSRYRARRIPHPNGSGLAAIWLAFPSECWRHPPIGILPSNFSTYAELELQQRDHPRDTRSRYRAAGTNKERLVRVQYAQALSRKSARHRSHLSHDLGVRLVRRAHRVEVGTGGPRKQLRRCDGDLSFIRQCSDTEQLNLAAPP